MLFHDLETFSKLDLRKVSLDRYAADPSTRILMCAYAADDGPMQFWQEGEDRSELDRMIEEHILVAWNKGFEENLIRSCWKKSAPLGWRDAMVHARYAGLPAGLKDCNRVPYFAGESVTTKETLLINKFCKPGKNGEIHNAITDPEDWAAFCDYCKRDVFDTRLIFRWLAERFPVPERVYDSWLLDQKINRRGIPIDLGLCFAANEEAKRLQELSVRNLGELTGLANANSPKQLLGWLAERGYPYNSLGKELVEKALDEMPDGPARHALQLRLDGAKSSIKKLAKILEQISPDHRLREQYRFYGAHTGRWSGRGAQPQNFKAPRTKEEKAAVEKVVQALVEGREVDSLADLSLSLRPVITAPKGKKIVLADFKSVENRVLAWLACCETLMQVYRDGRDPYIDFASRMEGIPYAEVSAELRQTAKPGTLGCGFGLGGGREVRRGKCSVFGTCGFSQEVPLEREEGTYDCPKCNAHTFKVGPKIKTGLWRYAEMMGVDLTQEQAQKQVNEFRVAFAEICELWYWLEEAYKACVRTKRSQKVGVLRFVYKDPALRVVLPSGRELVYNRPFAIESFDGGKKGLEIGFFGVKGKSWMRQTTYGGRLCENVVQAVALDLLVDAMVRTEADSRFEMVGTTHDEIITLADEKDADAVARLEGYMSVCEPWANGLLMAADGYEGKRYVKG